MEKSFTGIAVNRKGNKTLRNRKRATFVRILFSISRDHFENVFPEIIQKEKEKLRFGDFKLPIVRTKPALSLIITWPSFESSLMLSRTFLRSLTLLSFIS